MLHLTGLGCLRDRTDVQPTSVLRNRELSRCGAVGAGGDIGRGAHRFRPLLVAPLQQLDVHGGLDGIVRVIARFDLEVGFVARPVQIPIRFDGARTRRLALKRTVCPGR